MLARFQQGLASPSSGLQFLFPRKDRYRLLMEHELDLPELLSHTMSLEFYQHSVESQDSCHDEDPQFGEEFHEDAKDADGQEFGQEFHEDAGQEFNPTSLSSSKIVYQRSDDEDSQFGEEFHEDAKDADGQEFGQEFHEDAGQEFNPTSSSSSKIDINTEQAGSMQVENADESVIDDAMPEQTEENFVLHPASSSSSKNDIKAEQAKSTKVDAQSELTEDSDDMMISDLVPSTPPSRTAFRQMFSSTKIEYKPRAHKKRYSARQNTLEHFILYCQLCLCCNTHVFIAIDAFVIL